MEIVQHLIHFILHIDQYLQELISQYGSWIYAILFLILFLETGLVLTPLLPGDSLLFAAGAMAAVGELNVHLLVGLLITAAILGDAVNYAIGKWLGPKIFRKDQGLFLNKQYLERTHEFYEKYGAKTIIIARFIPIIRTFAPFVAGVGKMGYPKFFVYNVAGAILWVTSITYTSYMFGNIPIVKNNFSFVILGIIILSLTPPIIEYLRVKQPWKNYSK